MIGCSERQPFLLAIFHFFEMHLKTLQKENSMVTKLPLPSHRLHLVCCAFLVAIVIMPAASFAKSLVANQTAARLGLERAWFAQIRVDPAQHKVMHWLLDKDQLFALTSAGAVQSIDAETGKTLWTTEVGAGNAAAAGMAVNAKYVALLGAGQLYVLDRADGHHL